MYKAVSRFLARSGFSTGCRSHACRMPHKFLQQVNMASQGVFRMRCVDVPVAGDRVASTSYPCAPAVTAGMRRRRCWHASPSPAAPTTCRRAPLTACASSQRVADPVYIQEYQQLKENILGTARKAGGALALYLLLTVDGEAGLCALLGSAACNVYLQWLFRDVDNVTADTRIPLWEAEKIDNPAARNMAKVFAAYHHALKPRLLVPVALAAFSAAWNQLSDYPLDTAHQGFLLLGFLSYKAPLLLKLADDNATKKYRDEEMSRPLIEKFDDELDQWGRPKKPLVPLPTEALPENIDTSDVDLEKLSTLDGMVSMMGLQKRRHLIPGEEGGAAADAGSSKPDANRA